MLNWYAIESTAYYAASPASLSNENLYFLTDTHEIYRGTTPFTDAVVLYSGAKPTSPARKKIYIDTATLKGEVYTGTEWVTVIKPVVDTVVADGTDPVNSTAVIAYVQEQIANVTGSDGLVSNVTYDKGAVKMTVTMADGSTSDLVLESLATQLAYDKATGKLELKDVNGAVLGSAVNLDLERFVKGASYDSDTKTITMWFDDADDAASSSDKIDIPVGDLVDTYTAENTATIAMTVTGNKFSANVIASSAAGNVVELKDDGIYVAATDLSNYQTLVANASTTAIPMLNAAGQLINGTMTAGGATLSAAPNATTLATELAVNALVTSTKATIDAELAKKMALVDGATVDNIATFGANGQVKDSGKLVGGATLAATPNANTLATEVAVKAAIDASASDLNAKVTANTNAIGTLNGDASTAGSVAKAVNDLKTELNTSISKNATDIATNAGNITTVTNKANANAAAIEVLNGDASTAGSVAKAVADAKADCLVEGDIATALSSASTDEQVASAKAVYDQLTWKTSL